MLTPENTSLWIVSYKRYMSIKDTVQMWHDSFPFEEINIISNSWPQEYDFPRNYNVVVWPNLWRPTWMTGSLAWCWNQAMLQTFLTKDYCIMSQDDVRIEPGWDTLINNNDFYTYIAPHGDVVQVQTLEGFKRVGWFDERFRAIGGAEADYLLRMLKTPDYKLSAHDDHVWKLRHNDIGLANHFINPPKPMAVQQTRDEHNLRFAQKECFERWTEKWGIPVDDLFQNYLYEVVGSNWKEIDWYPAFSAKMIQEGRMAEVGYQNCL